MTDTRKVDLLFRSDVQNAPLGRIVLCSGNGGWRFMTRDSEGQWRSILGRPKPQPKEWADIPKEALSG